MKTIRTQQNELHAAAPKTPADLRGLTRRTFLKLAAAAGVTVTGSPGAWATGTGFDATSRNPQWLG